MSLQQFLFALDAASVVCFLIVGVQAMLTRPQLLTAQIVAVIAFDSICNVILSHYEYGPWMPPAFRVVLPHGVIVFCNLARNLTPALFMVLCYRLFADCRSFPLWLIWLTALQLFLEEPVRLLLSSGVPYAGIATQTLPALLETFFVAMALMWTIKDWRTDLVEVRRRVRAATAILIGVDVIASALLMRVIVQADSPLNYELHIAITIANLAIALLVLFQLTGEADVLLDPVHAEPPDRPLTPALLSEDAIALARLAALMENERLYRRPSLSLKALADCVGVPEYRLRRIVHEELGFANFNAFLHAFRIRDACEQLRDPAQRRVPILTIALTVGYQSVNTFNRGFREVTDMTPSVYRALAHADLPSRPQILSPKTA